MRRPKEERSPLSSHTSLEQWVGTARRTNDALCCCHMNALSRACQVRRLQRSRRQEGHQHTAVEAVCAKAASSCPRNSQLPAHDELLTRRSCSNRMKMQRTTRTSCPTRRSCGEKELCRELFPELFWWSAIFRRTKWRSILQLGIEILVQDAPGVVSSQL